MSTNKSQKNRIVGVLMEKGKITRNMCLANYISRLGAIICTLKSEGWDFRTEKDGGDYVYIVIKNPFKKDTL
jgi:hypothetical protein